MATRFSRQYDAREAKINAYRKSPYEIGKLHARLNRRREDCPFHEDHQLWNRDEYLRGFDQVRQLSE